MQEKIWGSPKLLLGSNILLIIMSPGGTQVLLCPSVSPVSQSSSKAVSGWNSSAKLLSVWVSRQCCPASQTLGCTGDPMVYKPKLQHPELDSPSVFWFQESLEVFSTSLSVNINTQSSFVDFSGLRASPSLCWFYCHPLAAPSSRNTLALDTPGQASDEQGGHYSLSNSPF